MSKEKKFIRVCISLDSSSISVLEDLAKKHHCSKSQLIKFLIYYYNNNHR